MHMSMYLNIAKIRVLLKLIEVMYIYVRPIM